MPDHRSLDQYYSDVYAYFNRHRAPENGRVRFGQAAMNVLYTTRPYLHVQIVGTELDPFYNDENLTAFFNFLAERWET